MKFAYNELAYGLCGAFLGVALAGPVGLAVGAGIGALGGDSLVKDTVLDLEKGAPAPTTAA